MFFKASVAQINTKNNLEKNLKKIERFVLESKSKGAELISFPEVVNYIPEKGEKYLGESDDGESINFIRKLAKLNSIWIHIGSISEYNGNKPYNTSYLIDNQGEIVSKYRKIHLFDAVVSGTEIKESSSFSAGEKIVTVKTSLAHFGLSICYDLRFPEIYTIMRNRGANVIFVPANFTYTTGKAHWKSLLRARAIENSCYIIAANQTGEKPKYKAYGHSMIVDPWGEYVEIFEEEGIIYSNIDLNYAKKCSEMISVKKNTRNEIYKVILKRRHRVE